MKIISQMKIHYHTDSVKTLKAESMISHFVLHIL